MPSNRRVSRFGWFRLKALGRILLTYSIATLLLHVGANTAHMFLVPAGVLARSTFHWSERGEDYLASSTGVWLGGRTSLFARKRRDSNQLSWSSVQARLLTWTLSERPARSEERVLIPWTGLVGPSFYTAITVNQLTGARLDRNTLVRLPWAKGDVYIVPTRPTWWLLLDGALLWGLRHAMGVAYRRARTWIRAFRVRRHGLGTCVECNYPLTDGGLCPECGHRRTLTDS
jgi:hypothetical protein